MAEGCVQAGCALIGGETAEHPGHFGPDDFDLAGAATGVVDADDLLGPHRVQPGDVVLALGSSGLHSNGFSLVRRVLDQAGLDLAAEFPELCGTLGAELLTPTRIYARDCLALAAGCDVHAYAHITGGGLAANLARVLPAGGRRGPGPGRAGGHQPCSACSRTVAGWRRPRWNRCSTWASAWPPCSRRADADRALGMLSGRGIPAWVLGEIVPGTGTARLAGRHPQRQDLAAPAAQAAR